MSVMLSCLSKCPADHLSSDLLLSSSPPLKGQSALHSYVKNPKTATHLHYFILYISALFYDLKCWHALTITTNMYCIFNNFPVTVLSGPYQDALELTLYKRYEVECVLKPPRQVV